LIVNLKATSSILSGGRNLQWSTHLEDFGGEHSAISADEPLLQIKMPLFLEKSTENTFLTSHFLIAPQFKNTELLYVKAEQKSSEIYFLEDILQWLDFNTPEMDSAKRIIRRGT
uniref:BEACH-type PH domain-containing protein n=1 Tax=Mesocestoides corti TaxID=53468 RepID=A0A5K3FPZ1_MESCO